MLKESLVTDSQEVDLLPKRSKGHNSQLPQRLTRDIPPFRALDLALHRWRKQRKIQEAKDIQRPIDKKLTAMPGSEGNIHAYYDGVEFVTENLWPLIFWVTFSYDLFNYQNPDNHYAMTLSDLFLGLPKNNDPHHISASINLGGDIPRFANYWPWVFIMGGAILSGYLFRYLSPHDDSLVVDDFNENEARSHTKKICQDLFLSLPYLGDYWAFQRLKRHLIEYDFEQKEEKDRREEKEKLYKEYEEQAKSFSSLASAIQLSKDLDLDHIVSRGLFRILILVSHRSYFAWKLGVDALAEIALYRQDRIGQFALETLLEFSEKNPYIHYKLWSIGESKNVLVHLLSYGVVTPLQLYSKFRWWMLNFTKIIGLAAFFKAWKNCYDQDKKWHYDNSKGKDVCVVCTEDFVDAERQETGAGCVAAFTSTRRSSTEFLDDLSSVKGHGPYTLIDVSQQSWPVWSIDDWKRFIGLLNSSDFREITTLNLSRSTPGILAITPDFLAVLADYLQTAIHLHHLILSGQMISSQGMMALLPGLRNNKQIYSLYLDKTNLNDSIFLQLLDLIPDMPELKTLSISGNQITGFSLKSLSNFSNSSLTYLDISNNFLASADVDQFPWNSTHLQVLNISYSDLSIGSLKQFSSSLINSSFIHLVMNNCQISDSLASTLFLSIAQSSIQILSWSNNNIGYAGMQTIAENLNMSNITHFFLDNNEIDDRAIKLLATSFNFSNRLSFLSLASNLFTAVGFGALISASTKSQLSGVIAAKTNLGDAGVIALISIPPDNLSLTQLDLSTTGMTVAGANALFCYSAKSSLTDLDVSQNLLEGDMDIGPCLRAALNHTPLRRLILIDTYVRSETLKSLWPVLRNSSVEVVDVSDNNVDDDCAIFLAGQLISDVPDNKTQFNSMEINNDFSRAVSGAKNLTQLKQFSCRSDTITAKSAYTWCLMANSAGIHTTDLVLSGQHITQGSSQIHGCPILTGTNQTSLALPNTTISWHLIVGLMGLILQPQIAKFPWKLLTACIGATLAAPCGLSGIVMGATIGYKAKEISIGALQQLNLFVAKRFFPTSSQGDEQSFWSFSR